MQVRHVDMKMAYLNGDLRKIIYMRASHGLRVGSDEICRFNKSFYGLKHSARDWKEELRDSDTSGVQAGENWPEPVVRNKNDVNDVDDAR